MKRYIFACEYCGKIEGDERGCRCRCEAKPCPNCKVGLSNCGLCDGSGYVEHGFKLVRIEETKDLQLKEVIGGSRIALTKEEKKKILRKMVWGAIDQELFFLIRMGFKYHKTTILLSYQSSQYLSDEEKSALDKGNLVFKDIRVKLGPKLIKPYDIKVEKLGVDEDE